MPSPTDPLTRSEVVEASDLFFDLFSAVLDRAPEGTSIEDALKISESVFMLAHKQRAKADEENAPFGFNKKNP